MTTLFEDTFAGALGAGWTETDTGNVAAWTAGGRFQFDGGLATPVWGDPGLRRTTALARSTLGAYGVLVRTTNSGGEGAGIALSPTTNPASPQGAGSGLAFVYPEFTTKAGTSQPPTAARARSIDHLAAIIPRPGGGYFGLLSGGQFGTFPTARLVSVEDSGADTWLYPLLWGKSAVFHVDYARALHTDELTGAAAIYTTAYGAATVADTFTRANGNLAGSTTDVGGKSWAVEGGTPTIATNKVSVPANARAFVNAGAHGSAVHIIEVTVTTGSTAGFEVIFRSDGTQGQSLGFYAEASECGLWNYSTNSYENNAQTGAFNAQPNTTYRVLIYDYGTHVRILFGTGGALNDAFSLVATTSLNTNTYVGLGSYNTTHTFDNLAVWPSSLPLPTNLGPFPAIPLGSGTPIVTEPFTAANGTTLPGHNAGWTVHSGTWEINNNAARMTAAGVTGAATRSTGAAGVNHQIKSTITVPNTTPAYPIDWFPGVIARFTDGNNYIQARLLYQDTSNEVEVWQYIAGDGGGGPIGYINLGINRLLPGSTHTLALAVNGNEIAAYLDNELVVQAYTTVTTGTRAGIGVSDTLPNGQPSWDDVEITATASAAAIVISNVSVTSPTSSTILATWITDVASDTRLEYATAAQWAAAPNVYPSIWPTAPALVLSHSVTVTGLAPGTTYYVRVGSQN